MRERDAGSPHRRLHVRAGLPLRGRRLPAARPAPRRVRRRPRPEGRPRHRRRGHGRGVAGLRGGMGRARRAGGRVAPRGRGAARPRRHPPAGVRRGAARRASRPSRSATSRGTGSTATWRPACRPSPRRRPACREAYAARGPAAAAAVRGRPDGLPAHRGRAARGAQAAGGEGRGPRDASASTSAPPSSSRSAAWGCPACSRRRSARSAGYQLLLTGRAGDGRLPSNLRRLDGDALVRGRPLLPGPRRRRGRRGHEARLRDRHGLHRRGHAPRLHGPRRLPGVPGDGGGDAALPAGGVRVERRRARGPPRPRARGRARACPSRTLPAPTAPRWPRRSCSRCCSPYSPT